MELKKLSEGKSKILYTDGIDIYLEFKGDVMCTKHNVQYDENIALLRAKTTTKLFQYLSTKIENINVPELVKPKMIRMQKMVPLPLEWIPRYIAAGSVVKRFGFTEGYVFSKPVLKIDYKTNSEDYLITDDLIIEKGILSEEELLEARKLCMLVADNLNELFASKGLTLWDFKLELGVNSNRDIYLIDEISFDGMRLKDTKTGSSMDKDVYRNTGNVEEVVKAYEEGYRRVFE